MLASHPCWIDNGGCSHLCIGVPPLSNDGDDTLVVSCKCPTGFLLHDDGKTCTSGISYYNYYIITL